jgi:hypothetical protein
MSTLPQPSESTIAIDIKDDKAIIKASDIERLRKFPSDNISVNSEDESETTKLIEYLSIEDSPQRRARVIYIEVQQALLHTNATAEKFEYTGGHAVAIGSKYLLTAYHVVSPLESWLDLETEQTIWCTTLILAADPNFELPEDKEPHETKRWSGRTEYEVEYRDPITDVALLRAKGFRHLKMPFANEALGHGGNIFTVSLLNPFSVRAFRGTAWLSDGSDGSYYDTTAYVDRGFSGGPVSGIDNLTAMSLIVTDRYGGFLGLVLSDAGKRREMGRFISAGRILEVLESWMPAYYREIDLDLSVRKSSTFSQFHPSPVESPSGSLHIERQLLFIAKSDEKNSPGYASLRPYVEVYRRIDEEMRTLLPFEEEETERVIPKLDWRMKTTKSRLPMKWN